jgi:GR25 family glycosyltransferase involved in LPS biosynthesis
MNLKQIASPIRNFIYKAALSSRKIVGKKRCKVFAKDKNSGNISNIYIINLDRSPQRWKQIKNELSQMLDNSGVPLISYATRVPAVDSLEFESFSSNEIVEDVYTLADQLYVDPRGVLPAGLNLEEKIQMSRQEIAVSLSHVKTWEKVASGNDDYVLILEDDVCFKLGFSRYVEKIWAELKDCEGSSPLFDILYLSYREVDCGAEKTLITKNTFRLFRGVWFLSGYVLSKRGAKRLLEQLPIKGPADLWINHKFSEIDALLASRSIISQRIDEKSENFYSVLPVLSKIGVLNTEAPGIFHFKPPIKPIFVIGKAGLGLTSLSMALSMLGYRCCSDLVVLPDEEQELLICKDRRSKFDAYVNIGSIDKQLSLLAAIYPAAQLVVVEEEQSSKQISQLNGAWAARILFLSTKTVDKWKHICDFLRVAPPS